MHILRITLIAALLLAFFAPAQAEPSHVFLLQGGRQGGDYLLGLQIKLTPGWMTYWREPGEAGIAPKIEITGSKNMHRVNVEFPEPKEFFEGRLKVRGYDTEVIFPLRVTPQNPRKPVHLRLKFSYGVCEKMCVLEAVMFNQKLSAKPAPEEAALITQARMHVSRNDQPLVIKGE